MSVRRETLSMLLAYTEPGDQDWSWRTQFHWLEEHHYMQLHHLFWDMKYNGQQKPIIVGPDSRLWDGHHRLWCAVALQWSELDVDFVIEGEEREPAEPQ